MKLNEQTIKAFGVAKVFKDNNDLINSLDYSDNGELLVTSADDDQILVYDCNSGTSKKTLNSKKYGCCLIRLTHAPNTALHGSTKIDDTIRYLSLHDNKYIRYFPGHTKRVVCLCMSPVDDTFLSGSLDRTIRLWDLRSPNCQGLMQLNSRPVAAFDPDGLIFAAGIGSESLKLYDLRSFDRGPFSTFKIPPVPDAPPGTEWTGLRFSPDGRSMLISTNAGFLRTVDAFDGRPLATLGGFANSKSLPMDATFTPDAQFVFCGSTDGKVHCWNASQQGGSKVEVLDSSHPKPIQNILFNPKFMLLVTACQQLCFWVPEIDE